MNRDEDYREFGNQQLAVDSKTLMEAREAYPFCETSFPKKLGRDSKDSRLALIAPE